MSESENSEFLFQSSECIEPPLHRESNVDFVTPDTVKLAALPQVSSSTPSTTPNDQEDEHDDNPHVSAAVLVDPEIPDDVQLENERQISLKGMPPARPLIEDQDFDDSDRVATNHDDDAVFDSFAMDAVTRRPPLPPRVMPTKKLSGRSESLQIRLRRQGFKALPQGISPQRFAVRSTRRGSSDWRSLIQNFVADLAFYSLQQARHFAEPTFRPYLCHDAAVLFVDLSGYSHITAQLAHHGAHAISAVVNAYLERLLRIIHRFGGDVIKFAGDAVLVVWHGSATSTTTSITSSEQQALGQLDLNVLVAAQCVHTLQEEAGAHPVEGSDVDGEGLVFRIHCGLACGGLDSEVFEAPTHVNMQRLYHSVSGQPMEEIGDLVDLAAAGETCVSEECARILAPWATFEDVPGVTTDAKLLESLYLNDTIIDQMEDHIERSMADRMVQRNADIEEAFIHPNVLKLLSHGGKSPTQIAQMRHVCVLFIAMVANGSSLNWLMEVQRILDRNRCPIVQIIDDDKGVHLVAAINLYEAIPESAVLGLDICEELQERQVGCAIGMAKGSAFCGVTGCHDVACRWDITGPPAVRAARLMQYAIKHGHEMVVDHSIFVDKMAATRLTLLHKDVHIKGTEEPCRIYTLSPGCEWAALRILETKHGSVHNETVHRIRDTILASGPSKRTMIVTGPARSGKKVVVQRAAGLAGVTPFLHVSSESAGYLQLAGTIAMWFKHVHDRDVRALSSDVLKHLHSQRWSRAHDACVDLMNLAVMMGLKACFVVDRVQLLDEFSFSLIRECVRGRKAKNKRDLQHKCADLLANASDSGAEDDGRLFFFCIHVNLYRRFGAQDVKDRICRSHSNYDIPIFTIGRASAAELRTLCHEICDLKVSERCIKTFSVASGFCAGYFCEKMAASRRISGEHWAQRKNELIIINDDLELEIPVGMYKANRDIAVQEVSADAAMKFTQIYDENPPLFQTFLKVLTVSQRGLYYGLKLNTVWEVLNDLIAHGVERETFQAAIKEMEDMFLIEIGKDSDGEKNVSLLNPALGDIAFDVCTPEQIRAYCEALSNRLQNLQNDFHVPFLLARFYNELEEDELKVIHFWKRGYKMLLKSRNKMSDPEFNQTLEAIDEEITSFEFDTKEVLGISPTYPGVNERHLGMNLLLIKFYNGPVSFGPHGQTCAAIARSIFHEANSSFESRVVHDLAGSCQRYCQEALEIEVFLRQFSLYAPQEELNAEFEIVKSFTLRAETTVEAGNKASSMLNLLIPRYIERRRERLLKLVDHLRQSQGALPHPIAEGDPTILQALQLFLSEANKNDAAHDALMCLAVHHWSPKRISEKIPLVHRQTIASIRNKVLRSSWSDTDHLLSFRHKQGPGDLGAFLLTTALLHGSVDLRDCYH